MNADLTWLALAAALTGLIWVPYVLDRFAVRGIMDTVGYPENPKPQSPWAVRMQAAHRNAVENLVVFAALVLAVHAAGLSNGVTAGAAAVYFWARLVHVFAHTFAVPWIRTLAFVVGFGCQFVVAWQILIG